MDPDNLTIDDIIEDGLKRGLRDAVVKLYTVLSSSQLDDASLKRFEQGLQKTVEAYQAAVELTRRGT
jgi:hypothetical protein